MNKATKGRLVLLLALVAALVAGCGQNGATAGGQQAGAAANSVGASGGSDAAGNGAGGEANAPTGDGETRTIRHAMGETTITGTPVRIVSLYQGANDAAVAFGVKPVGIVESWLEQPVYSYLREALGDVQQLGTEDQPNLEEVTKLQPDVIFAAKLRHEKIYGQLSVIAPTVMIDEVYDWQDTVRLMGETLNRQEDADRLMREWKERVADFKAKMGDRLPMEATVTNFRADHARIFYMGYAGGILKELGFSRPPGHDENIWGVQLTTKESIPQMNADVIFNFNSGVDAQAVENFYNDWTGHPLWSNLDAVKSGQVFAVDEVAWNFAGGYLSAHRMLDQLYDFFELEK